MGEIYIYRQEYLIFKIMANYKEIDNLKETGSSALCLDIRNSTKLMRKFNNIDLKTHAALMNNIKSIFFDKTKVGSLSISDTGDGMMCLFWNPTHCWSALMIAIAINDLINESLKKEYDKFLQKKGIDEEFGFGIGVHTGGSLVYRDNSINHDLMYGKVLNTTARLESFTKTFTNVNVLFSGHFITTLKSQREEFNKISYRKEKHTEEEIDQGLIRVSPKRVDIADGKKNGHTIWTFRKDHLKLL
jgi:class 3 adenylate cyclase